MPLPVAAMLNLLAVPIDPDQISRSLVPPPALGWGSRSQAPSDEPAPVLPEESTTQTIAEVGSVPLEVITGDPELYPRDARTPPSACPGYDRFAQSVPSENTPEAAEWLPRGR